MYRNTILLAVMSSIESSPNSLISELNKTLLSGRATVGSVCLELKANLNTTLGSVREISDGYSRGI